MKELIELEVYADEVINKDYICFGILFIPLDVKLDLIDKIKNLRCRGTRSDFNWDFNDCSYNYNCRKEYHTLNNSEIHFRNIDSSKSRAVKDISIDWLRFLFENIQNDNKLFFFKISYIEIKKMDMGHFGFEKIVENLYNRFLGYNNWWCKIFF